MKPKNKADFQRIINATNYSIKGLRAAYINEAAFRQELWCTIILFPLALILGDTNIEKVLLVATILLVLITELLNSAIESVVDRIGSDFHELRQSKRSWFCRRIFINDFTGNYLDIGLILLMLFYNANTY